MEHNYTGCQAPEAPKLCINNCGFFGNSATMNMCSKCHKDHTMKQQQAKLAASSIESMVSGGGSSSSSSSSSAETTVSVKAFDVCVVPSELKTIPTTHSEPAQLLVSDANVEVKPEEQPKRCNTCRKRVGLTGFSCRCGHLFCAAHRFSEKHDCRFDYRAVGRDAIAKANPVVKANKIEKI